MQEIKMVDLNGQYQKIKAEIDAEIQKVIDSTAFINGPVVKEFAQNLADYLKVKHVIPCGNGTDALQIALMALELKPGDEVITPDFTFISTVEVMKVLGLQPVYVDVDKDTFNLDPQLLEKAITKKTKAVIPVHLFGQCTNMDEIMQIAGKHNLFVIEDAAQAIGSVYQSKETGKKYAGTLGDIGCTSFFPSKNLGAYGDGGALFTDNDEIAEKLKMIVNHGSKVKYHHEIIGVNSRLDSVQAAILNVKLRNLDDYNQARNKAADFYDEHLSKLKRIRIPKRNPQSTHVFHQYTIITESNQIRDDLKLYLSHNNIPTMIYYPIPMHLQKAYQDEKYKKGDFPITEDLCKRVLSLPMHTELSEEEQKDIISSIINFFS